LGRGKGKGIIEYRPMEKYGKEDKMIRKRGTVKGK
jgi:hypothetical protein